MLNLIIEYVKDQVARENFLKVFEFVRDENVLSCGFKHFEFVFSRTATNLRLPHRLGFQPKDVIQTWLTGSGTVTWNYSLFNSDFLDVTVGGTVTTTNPTTVRILVGRFTNTGA